MRYGFVIDQNRCIGCHACTVACKEEHNIAVGVNRTWVKYIEKGHYPDTRRHFAVLRCNHCDDAPCIEICPTVALFRRRDGIVDFDNERCIGCKSCMQACPYDALYIDPDRNTAAKCNFDASRVEMGYKPACEVVCPTQAILSGDLDDPNSQISRRIAMEKVSVRKPEKGTKPKLFYVGVDGDLLNPTMMEPQSTHFWAEKSPGEDLYALKTSNAERSMPGVAREVYDVPHITPWGKKIASYLWTKSIAAGVILLSALLLNMGFEQDALVLNFFSPALALIFLAATMLLLVFDLKRPDRFFYLFTKPNPRSWLVLGGYVLMIFGVLASGLAFPRHYPGSDIHLDRLVDGALCCRVGRLFRFSFCPSQGTRLLAESAAVLAPADSGHDGRGGGPHAGGDSHRLEPADVLLAWVTCSLFLCWPGWRTIFTELFMNRRGEEVVGRRICFSQEHCGNNFGSSSSSWGPSRRSPDPLAESVVSYRT